jgi:hypothetical protein
MGGEAHGGDRGLSEAALRRLLGCVLPYMLDKSTRMRYLGIEGCVAGVSGCPPRLHDS